MQLLVVPGIGLVVGMLARAIASEPKHGDWLMSMLLGVFGAFTGDWLARPLGMYDEGCPVGWLVPVFGAFVFLLGQAAWRGTERPLAPAPWKPTVFGGPRNPAPSGIRARPSIPDSRRTK